MTSVRESNSLPTLDVPLINLATLPSRVSRIAAKPIAIQPLNNLNLLQI